MWYEKSNHGRTTNVGEFDLNFMLKSTLGTWWI